MSFAWFYFILFGTNDVIVILDEREGFKIKQSRLRKNESRHFGVVGSRITLQKKIDKQVFFPGIAQLGRLKIKAIIP